MNTLHNRSVKLHGIAAVLLLTLAGCAEYQQAYFDETKYADSAGAYQLFNRDTFEALNLVDLLDPFREGPTTSMPEYCVDEYKAGSKAGSTPDGLQISQDCRDRLAYYRSITRLPTTVQIGTNTVANVGDSNKDAAVQNAALNREVWNIGMAYLAFHDRYSTPSKALAGRIRRDEIQSQIIAASQQRCNAFVTRLQRDHSRTNFWLGVGSTTAATAAAIITSGSSQSWAGLSAVLSGTRAEYNQDYFANLTVNVISDGIQKRRKDILSDIMKVRTAQGVDSYPVSQAIHDALLYHGACSIVEGMKYAEGSIKEVDNPGLFMALKTLKVQKALDIWTKSLKPGDAADIDKLIADSDKLRTSAEQENVMPTGVLVSLVDQGTVITMRPEEWEAIHGQLVTGGESAARGANDLQAHHDKLAHLVAPDAAKDLATRAAALGDGMEAVITAIDAASEAAAAESGRLEVATAIANSEKVSAQDAATTAESNVKTADAALKKMIEAATKLTNGTPAELTASISDVNKARATLEQQQVTLTNASNRATRAQTAFDAASSALAKAKHSRAMLQPMRVSALALRKDLASGLQPRLYAVTESLKALPGRLADIDSTVKEVAKGITEGSKKIHEIPAFTNNDPLPLLAPTVQVLGPFERSANACAGLLTQSNTFASTVAADQEALSASLASLADHTSKLFIMQQNGQTLVDGAPVSLANTAGEVSGKVTVALEYAKYMAEQIQTLRTSLVKLNEPIDSLGTARLKLEGAIDNETGLVRMAISRLDKGITKAGTKGTDSSKTSTLAAPVVTGLSSEKGTIKIDFAQPLLPAGETIAGYTATGVSPSGQLTAVAEANASTISLKSCKYPANYKIELRGVTTSGKTTLPVSMERACAAAKPGAAALNEPTSDNGKLKLDFTAPADDGGQPITAYAIKAKSTAATPETRESTVTDLRILSSTLDCTVGQTYTLKVTAKNAVGDGPEATTNEILCQ